jgi:alpha-glucosidase
MFDMYQKHFPDERLFIISRAGFIGDWRYGAGIWSGDVNCSWSHLKNQVPIGISSSLSGYGLWNSDVGGFHGVPSPELYTRWMQFGAFCPIYRAHGDHSIREPFSFGEQAEQNLKKILNLRYRLSPYLYTNFYELHTSGKPVMRAMFLEFPEDSKAYLQESQYMYGPWLLVAPVTRQKAGSREVYLPAGKWTDFWTEKIVSGPLNFKAEAPLDRIPLFVREGAILPLAPLMQYTGEKPVNPLTLEIYPGPKPSAYEVYEDDGRSNAYLAGEYALTRVEFIPGESMQLKVSVRGDFRGRPKTRSYLLSVHHVSRPERVWLGKTPLPESTDDLPANSSWSYDADKAVARIFVSEATEFTVSILAGPAR